MFATQIPARHVIACIAAVLACSGCAAPAPSAPPTLYERMGGEPVVRRVVDDVIDRTASDPRTERSFREVKMSRLKEKLREQLCNVAGGPCRYTGDPMNEVHKGLKITEAEWNLMVQFLRDALERSGVRDAEKNELLRILAPMKRDIVSPAK